MTPVSRIPGTAPIFSAWLLADTCLECHGGCSKPERFWRHLPIRLAHQPRGMPPAPRSTQRRPARRPAEGGHSPGPRGCTPSSASPGTRHHVLRCDASQQPAPGSTGPQTGLVSRRKSSFPNRSSLSRDPVLGRTAPLTWLLIHLPY